MGIRRFTAFAVPVLAIAMAPLAGCKDKAATGGGKIEGVSGTEIVVGEYGSMTGSESTFGKSTDDGIRLASEEIDSKGGLNNRKIAVPPPEDDESIAQKAETAARRLVDKGVVAVIGEVASSASLAAAPVCQQNHIPMVSPSSTNPKVTQVGDYVFRVCFIDPFQAAVVASFARKTLKANTAAIFYDQGQAYSVGFRDEFTKAFEKDGGKVVQEASYSKDDKDYKSPLTQIKAANPDCILVPGYYTQAGTIAKQARDLGITVPLLGGDGWDSQELFTYAGKSIGNCYFSNHMSPDDPNPVVQHFVASYKAKYGHVPDALAALGYDAMGILYDAMKRAKSLSGPDLRDAIASTKDYDGVTGKITINKDRNADKSAVIIEVKDGAFHYKERIANP